MPKRNSEVCPTFFTYVWFFWNYGITGYKRPIKCWSTFPINVVFDRKVNSGQIWGKIIQPFWWFGLRIFLKCCSKIEYSRYTTVTVNFSRKYLFWKIVIWTQFEPKLCSFISNDQLWRFVWNVLGWWGSIGEQMWC